MAPRRRPPAVGFDRSRLDPALLDSRPRGRRGGPRGWPSTAVDLAGGATRGPRPRAARCGRLGASVVVGADGPHSVVARAAGVARPARLAPRIGLTYHLAGPRPGRLPRRADAGPARRLRRHRARCRAAGSTSGSCSAGRGADALARDGARAVADGDRRAPSRRPTDDAATWRDGEPLDAVAGASPLGHRVTRRAGPGWLLVGDAAGFLDPFTGEGLHRALVSAELAAAAIVGARSRTRTAPSPPTTARCSAGSSPRTPSRGSSRRSSASPLLFDYAARRVAARPAVRATMGLVMGDLVPAARALDPRFLAALLAP